MSAMKRINARAADGDIATGRLAEQRQRHAAGMQDMELPRALAFEGIATAVPREPAKQVRQRVGADSCCSTPARAA